MHIGLLGTLEVRAGTHVIDPGPPKQRVVLAVLSLAADQVVSVDQLIDAVWPTSPPRTAAHSIQIYVSDLRKAFAGAGFHDVIVTRAPGYLLSTAAGAVIDIRRFDACVDVGMDDVARGASSGAALLREALTLWRGHPLAEFAYHDFAIRHIERLEGRRFDALEHLAVFELEDGREALAIEHASAVLAGDPTRERARYVELRALYRLGQHVEALRRYEQFRRSLADELGLEPSPQLQQLQGQILLHAPALAFEENYAEVRPSGKNPYKGLEAFTEHDAADFFGRDALVEVLFDRVASGHRLVTLLGPSGSGKSSVLSAGLLNQLRLAGWMISPFVPGLDGSEAIAAALDRPGEAVASTSQRQAVVIDQFEELLIRDDDDAAAIRRAVVTAVTSDVGPTVVLAIRADFYDRALADNGLAALVSSSVVPVLPLTVPELQAAITRPAERADHVVEPRLVAALLADASARPSALPLLQYALTELFDQADGPVITWSAYHELGGLRGVLSRRADLLYESLSIEDREIARQVLLRLVQPQGGQYDVRRRVRVDDLVGTGVDIGDLSRVLRAFGRHRLLSFDHEPLTGAATVEVAHEALLREWDRLATWIEENAGLLRRVTVLAAATSEWERAGRHQDYLLVGAHLADIDGPDLGHHVRLSAREQDFLRASRDQRALAARRDVSARRRRRRRSAALVVAALVAAVTVVAVRRLPTEDRVGPVGLVYQGDRTFEYFRLIEDGFDTAAGAVGLETRKRPVGAPWQADIALEELAADGIELIVTAVAGLKLDQLAPRYPRTRFAVIDRPVDHPNVTHLQFAVHEASFLAGVAAALTSRTGVVGFVGGADSPTIWPFAAGFEAGARAVDPSITVLSKYLGAAEDLWGFQDLRGAQVAATKQYEAGADVVFQAAGDAGFGVFAAAAEASARPGVKRWAIGVDSDQYQTVVEQTGNPDAFSWQLHILTSVLKRTDVALRALLDDYRGGRPIEAVRRLDLSSGGVGVAYSGHFLDPHLPTLAAWDERVRSGSVTVPCLPSDRRQEGPAPDYCER